MNCLYAILDLYCCRLKQTLSKQMLQWMKILIPHRFTDSTSDINHHSQIANKKIFSSTKIISINYIWLFIYSYCPQVESWRLSMFKVLGCHPKSTLYTGTISFWIHRAIELRFINDQLTSLTQFLLELEVNFLFNIYFLNVCPCILF